ncbi:recombinase family protein [Clostridium magnum]|uniref:DNA-invertase hin n=1 Tax=Clostridium magnum DSM 2767 TaxID=1121326 RepID=A0A161XG73_9CLOT|nr:recombinase family protein [Clostridium magnum]KZL93586.1 DNA-invertase hin [Clostridium magnum DSM 2767]SHI59127.1 site-specific DNA recombinase [Clostridium magnum DSM 2767]
MIAAIYSRKSKFTGKGESIENQIQLCTNHAKSLGIDEFLIYEDEGFSGRTTDRPQFQKMLKDGKSKKFSFLICYRLDRISRNIADFSTLINELQELNIDFISIREQFDTSTPMGRAMMYIASVFAQLERETIAERIRDNMLELAKSGRWLGGQTPLGFRSEKMSYFDSEFKERSMYKLTPIDNELTVIKLIYNRYLEFKSLRKVTQYLLEHNIKTKLGADWNVRSVSDVLSNPTYVKADINVFDYLNKKGIITTGTPDSIHGMLTYNKKKGTNQYREMDEWIATVAKHEGIIEAANWLEIQETLKTNKVKAPQLGRTHNALLTGILRCGKCGANMTVIHGGINKDGKKIYYYSCAMKTNSKGTRCNNGNVRVDKIEQVTINKLKEITKDDNILIEELKSLKDEISSTTDLSGTETISKSIAELEISINNLVKQLAENKNSSAAKYIITEIENRENELTSLRTKLNNINNENEKKYDIDVNLDLIIKSLSEFSKTIEMIDIDYKKYLLSSVVDKITWDSSTGHIDIKLWGGAKKK